MQPAVPVTTSAGALSALQSAQGSQQSGQQILQGQEASLGVPGEQQQVSGLRQAITNTTNLLNNVAPSVYGRTQNSLETSAQANREIQNESAPISATLSKQGTDLSNQESDLNTNLSRASTLAGLQSSDQQNQISNLSDLYKSLYGQEQDQIKNDQNQQQINNSASSSSSGGLTAAQQLAQSTAAAQQQTVQKINSQLSKATGNQGGTQAGDSFVSPQSYANAASDWVKAGYSLKDFNNYFGQYKNPTNAYYNI